VSEVFRVHWFWKRFNRKDAESQAIEREMQAILAKRKKQRAPNKDTPSSITDGGQGSMEPSRSNAGSRQGVFDSSRSVHLGERKDIVRVEGGAPGIGVHDTAAPAAEAILSPVDLCVPKTGPSSPFDVEGSFGEVGSRSQDWASSREKSDLKGRQIKSGHLE
jgi:hypothetical protein